MQHLQMHALLGRFPKIKKAHFTFNKPEFWSYIFK